MSRIAHAHLQDFDVAKMDKQVDLSIPRQFINLSISFVIYRNPEVCVNFSFFILQRVQNVLERQICRLKIPISTG